MKHPSYKMSVAKFRNGYLCSLIRRSKPVMRSGYETLQYTVSTGRKNAVQGGFYLLTGRRSPMVIRQIWFPQLILSGHQLHDSLDLIDVPRGRSPFSN